MRRQFPTTNRKGFTAIEIAMVASVIAILALLILPLFRNRSEEAKFVAAKDELQSLAKALLLAEADTAHFYRLQDLDNGTGSTDDPIVGVPYVWSGASATFPNVPWATLDPTLRSELVPPSGNVAAQLGSSYWRGPYISFQKSIPYTTLKTNNPQLFVSAGGPIYEREDGGEHADDRLPADPWGSPYLFINLAETGYGARLLYSMGPNGLPGGTAGPYVYTSFRVGGSLGLGDDLEYIF